MKKKLLTLISILVLTIAIIAGSTYAYFDLVVNNDNHVTSNFNTKDLSLKFTDGPKVELTDVLPGATIIKTFSVENIGTETLYYTIYLNDVINSFTRNSDLVYTLTSTNDGAVIGETELPKTSKALYQNIEIPVNTTQEYTLTITYKNLNENQNADMGKMFSGTIQLVAGVKTYNLTGYAYDNNGDLMNSGTVEVHSDVISAPINSDGSFTLENVSVGDHEIIIKDADNTIIAEDTFKLETKADENTITNNEIKLEEEIKTLTISVNNKASDNVEIKILGNLNTVDLIVNNGYSSSSVLSSFDGQKTNVVTISPENHYHFKNITCDNNIEYTLSGNQLYVNSLTTSGTCTINYEIDTVNVELNVSNGTGTETKTINYGDTTTFTSSPTTGYHYNSLSCTNNQTATLSGTTVTTGEITSDTVCTLSYAINTYSVQLAVSNGSGATTKSVNHGGSTTFTSSPTTGYHYSSISCTNGQSATLSGTTVTTGEITSDTVCTLSYAINTYSVQLKVSNGTGATTKTVNYNSTTTFSSSPNSGYKYGSISCTNSQTASYSGTTVTTGKITNNTVCTLTYVIACDYNNGKTWDFAYTGGVQSFTVPCKGTYKLEVWGAQGGTVSENNWNSSQPGGKGGYASGSKSFAKNTVIYIAVGGQGGSKSGAYYSDVESAVSNGAGGGYNGGGAGGKGGSYTSTSALYKHTIGGAGGGGATHMASTNRGVLANYNSYRGELYIVAGGGGGGAFNGGNYSSSGGTGGGTSGGSSIKYSGGCNGGTPAQSSGASQSSGYSFGNGQAGRNAMTNADGSSAEGGGGGGGGYFGGYASQTTTGLCTNAGGGGGSGYTGGVSSGSMSNGQRSGHGYARITLVTATA